MRVRGGEAPNTSAIAGKCDDDNINSKEIAEEVRRQTRDYKGKKVDVEIKLNSNKKCEVRVLDTGKEIASKTSEETTDIVNKTYSLGKG